jgi:hypothetical protein
MNRTIHDTDNLLQINVTTFDRVVISRAVATSARFRLEQWRERDTALGIPVCNIRC